MSHRDKAGVEAVALVPSKRGRLVELKQLRSFVAVAESLHFGRAAERLHVAQPALSVQIKALEQEIGARLLFRTTRKVSLTSTGALFLEEARETLERADEALRRARSLEQDSIQWLRIGGVDTATAGLLPKVIRDFRKKIPNVDLRISEMLTAPAIEALSNHHLDLAFVRVAPADPLLSSRHVLSEPLVALLPADHRLAQKRMVSREQMAQEPLVLPPRSARPIYYDMIREWFREAGSTLVVAQEANERHMILAIVAAGLGISILPKWVSQFRFPDVVFRPIREDPPVVHVHLVRRKSYRSNIADEFEAIIDKHL